MHSSLVFDTLEYANKLKQAGVPDKQAEIQAEAIAEIICDNLATKKDIVESENRLKTDIKEIEYKLTIRLGGLIVVGITVLAALLRIIHV